MNLIRRLDRNYSLLVLGASVILMMVSSGTIFLLVVALKPISAELGWSRTLLSSAYSFLFLGTGVGGVFIGYWLDRSGMAKPAAMGGLMIASGTLIAGAATNPIVFLMTYGIMLGLLGQATMFGPLSANITHWFTRRRGAAVGLVAGGQSLAGILWPPIFRYFNEWIGWRDTFLWFALLAFVTMVPLSVIFKRKSPSQLARAKRQEKESDAGRPVKTETMARTTLGISTGALQAILCVAIIGCCISMSLPLAHLVSHATDIGISTANAAELLSVLLLGSFVSRGVLLGMLVDRVGGLRALIIFSAGQAVSLLILGLMQDLTGLFIIAAVFGLSYGAILPAYPIIIREYMPASEIGRRTGIVILFGTIGMAIGGWLGGIAFDTTGSYVPAFLTGVAANLGNVVIIGALIYRTRFASPAPRPA